MSNVRYLYFPFYEEQSLPSVEEALYAYYALPFLDCINPYFPWFDTTLTCVDPVNPPVPVSYNSELAVLDNLFDYGAIPLFVEYVESIKDIKMLKNYLKNRKKELLFLDSNQKIKIIAKKILSLYQESKFGLATKEPSYKHWVKMLQYALKTQEFELVDPIWKSRPKWQECFCTAVPNELHIYLNRFVSSLKAQYHDITEMIWHSNKDLLNQYIADLSDEDQENILKNVIEYGTDKLIDSYLPTAESHIINKLEKHEKIIQWQSRRIVLLETMYPPCNNSPPSKKYKRNHHNNETVIETKQDKVVEEIPQTFNFPWHQDADYLELPLSTEDGFFTGPVAFSSVKGTLFHHGNQPQDTKSPSTKSAVQSLNQRFCS